ncbi:hypothetical protein BO71DRAFT_50314 [Aspergillus ellipticus CBS 707.79]|uniref:Uncharacterized protein n=1 Tax=Aspergillus ellipticus CBS 707.79 TaxID=1448320 RepID=A0A319DLU5_9EURO|nr:hypothetical protein BO71DRAFT_50314 [Aspergillus ellipticus CBS 707.79]
MDSLQERGGPEKKQAEILLQCTELHRSWEVWSTCVAGSSILNIQSVSPGPSLLCQKRLDGPQRSPPESSPPSGLGHLGYWEGYYQGAGGVEIKCRTSHRLSGEASHEAGVWISTAARTFTRSGHTQPSVSRGLIDAQGYHISGLGTGKWERQERCPGY